MENGSNRSLAYQLAAVIPNDDLQNITGGANNGPNATLRKHIKLSASNINQRDASFDITGDF